MSHFKRYWTVFIFTIIIFSVLDVFSQGCPDCSFGENGKLYDDGGDSGHHWLSISIGGSGITNIGSGKYTNCTGSTFTYYKSEGGDLADNEVCDRFIQLIRVNDMQEVWSSGLAHNSYTFSNLSCGLYRLSFRIRHKEPLKSCGNSDASAREVYAYVCIKPNPVHSVSTTTPVICGSGSSTLTLSTPSLYTVKWRKNDVDIPGSTGLSSLVVNSADNVGNNRYAAVLLQHTNNCPVGSSPTSNQVYVCVFDKSNISITGLNTTYCTTDPPIDLTGMGIPSGGVFEGAGVVFENSKYYFKPQLTGPGSKIITYKFLGETCSPTCSSSTTFTTQVVTTPATPTIIGSSSCGQSSSILTLTNSGDFNSFKWYKDNVAIPNSNSATLTIAAPVDQGSHTYKAEILGYTSGCVINSPVITSNSTICLFPYSTFSISGLKDFYCPSDTRTEITGAPIGGVFSGTGVVTENSKWYFDPVLARTASNGGPGIKQVTYNFSNQTTCGCPNTITKKTLVVRPARILDSVLSASAIRLNDNWTVDENSAANLPPLADLGSFHAGFKGVWRGEESYVYVTERVQTSQLNIKEDGVFHQFEAFDHDNGAMEECFYKWRKTNTITHYDNNSNETENRDIQGVHSSALFGYNGDLATAVSANSENQEFGFISFEELTAGTTISPTSSESNNLVFSSTSTVGDKELLVDFIVEIATDNVLTLNISPGKAAILNNKYIRVYGSSLDFYSLNSIHGIYKVTQISNHTDPNKSLVTINSTNIFGIWKGRISTQLSKTAPVFSNGNLQIVKVEPGASSIHRSHTGKQALMSTGTIIAEQYKLNLNGNSYVVSGWVNADNGNAAGFDNGSRGIQLRFYDSETGTSYTSSPLLKPKGFVIDNWQRIEETITIPPGTVRIALVLESGGTAWWDDLRLFPADGSMKTFVYNNKDYTLQAVLDANNYATFYYYGPDGSLQLIKQETERGVVTVQESKSHIAE